MITGAVMRPLTGKVVPYQLTQPVEDLLQQGKKYGYPNGGTIGNAGHLRKEGDHTPWAVGKLPGWIYAKDTTCPAGFREWLLGVCRTPGYDTTWIDFFNIDGKQYDGAGRYLKRSDDTHFHVSVKKGHEKTHVTLFDDFANRGEVDDMPSAEDIAAAVWKSPVSSPAFDKGKPHGVHEGVINAIEANRRAKFLESEMTALRNDVRAVLEALKAQNK